MLHQIFKSKKNKINKQKQQKQELVLECGNHIENKDVKLIQLHHKFVI